MERGLIRLKNRLSPTVDYLQRDKNYLLFKRSPTVVWREIHYFFAAQATLENWMEQDDGHQRAEERAAPYPYNPEYIFHARVLYYIFMSRPMSDSLHVTLDMQQLLF